MHTHTHVVGEQTSSSEYVPMPHFKSIQRFKENNSNQYKIIFHLWERMCIFYVSPLILRPRDNYTITTATAAAPAAAAEPAPTTKNNNNNNNNNGIKQ